MTVRFTPISTAVVRAYQAGGVDANGQLPERQVSDGGGNPCRHCLQMIPAGAGMLILAHRPFPAPQPYAEIGPIFLCADACATARMTGSCMARARWCRRRGSLPRRRCGWTIRVWLMCMCALPATTAINAASTVCDQRFSNGAAAPPTFFSALACGQLPRARAPRGEYLSQCERVSAETGLGAGLRWRWR